MGSLNDVVFRPGRDREMYDKLKRVAGYQGQVRRTRLEKWQSPPRFRKWFLVHPVQRVDFFATGVSQDQWGVIRRETRPLPHGAPSQALAAQACDQLQFPIADPYAVDDELSGIRVAKVNVTPIAGPVRKRRRTV